MTKHNTLLSNLRFVQSKLKEKEQLQNQLNNIKNDIDRLKKLKVVMSKDKYSGKLKGQQATHELLKSKIEMVDLDINKCLPIKSVSLESIESLIKIVEEHDLDDLNKAIKIHNELIDKK